MSEIRKIMEKESALKIIDEIKNKICEVDLDELCGDEVSVVEGESSTILKKVIQAVQCGLVEWDEEENCMVQTLIHPLKSGQLTAEKLYYKNTITLGDARGMKAVNQAELTIQSISNITARPTQLIEKIRGQDLHIAIGCLSFFDR